MSRISTLLKCPTRDSACPGDSLVARVEPPLVIEGWHPHVQRLGALAYVSPAHLEEQQVSRELRQLNQLLLESTPRAAWCDALGPQFIGQFLQCEADTAGRVHLAPVVAALALVARAATLCSQASTCRP